MARMKRSPKGGGKSPLKRKSAGGTCPRPQGKPCSKRFGTTFFDHLTLLDGSLNRVSQEESDERSEKNLYFFRKFSSH